MRVYPLCDAFFQWISKSGGGADDRNHNMVKKCFIFLSLIPWKVSGDWSAGQEGQEGIQRFRSKPIKFIKKNIYLYIYISKIYESPRFI